MEKGDGTLTLYHGTPRPYEGVPTRGTKDVLHTGYVSTGQGRKLLMKRNSMHPYSISRETATATPWWLSETAQIR